MLSAFLLINKKLKMGSNLDGKVDIKKYKYGKLN
jgi:hypothetical protein